MASLDECPFCDSKIASAALWENAHYRIIADQYPRCVGHILLLSKTHLASHMCAPFDYLPKLKAAHVQARQFLMNVFGKVSFWENGGSPYQEVLHAHLHGMPVSLRVPDHWIAEHIIRPVKSWEDAWQKCQQVSPYCYIETGDQSYLLQRDDHYLTILNEARSQLAVQGAVELEPGTGDIKCHGTAMMNETIHLWKIWSQNKD